MKRILGIGVLAAMAAMMLFPMAAVAEEDTGPFALSNFSASALIGTDYVFRGLSQTSENPTIQGSLDYAHPCGFYLGAWGSNVYKDVSDGGIELDYYAGWGKSWGGFGLDLMAVYYHYPGAINGSDVPDPNFFETHVGLSYTIEGGAVVPTFGLGWNWSPDFYGEDGKSSYLNFSVGLGLPYNLSVSGEAGYQDVSGDKLTGNGGGLDGKDGYDYWHWRLGVGYSIFGFDLDLSYHDTNEEEFLGVDNADKRVVFGISRTF